MDGFVIDRLRGTLGDRLTTPDDPGYHDARQTFNATIQRRPAAIVRARSDDDVVSAVVAAGDLGLPIAVRGGGHSVAGHAMADGALVVDMRDLRAVTGRPGDEGRPGSGRGALGRRRRRGLGPPSRGRRRHLRRHGRGRSRARWRDRLAVRAGRLHLRQPDPGRARDRRRRACRGRSGRRSRPALGAARGRRQLRRRDLVRVPRHRPGADRGRLHRVPGPRRTTGPPATGRGRVGRARRPRAHRHGRCGQSRQANDSSASGCAGRATRRRRPTSSGRSRPRSRP